MQHYVLVAVLVALTLLGLTLVRFHPPLMAEAGAAEDESRELQKITAARDRETAAFNAGNLDELASFLASDYVFLPNGHATLHGREAGRAHFAAARARYAADGMSGHLTVEPERIWIDGGLAVEHGHLVVALTPKEPGKERRIEMRYVEIWRRQADGSWQVACDINNTSAPQEP